MNAVIIERDAAAGRTLPAPAIPDLTLPQFVLAAADRRGSKRALVDAATGHELSYAGLAVAVRESAAGLSARGVRPGDVLALCAPNCIEFAVAWYAATLIGAVVTTVNPLCTGDEISRQLRQTGARWLVATSGPVEQKLRAVIRRDRDRGDVRDRRARGRDDPLRVTSRGRIRAGRARLRVGRCAPADLQRHDRIAQERRTDPPEPGGQLVPDAAGPPGGGGRRGDRGAAALSHLRAADHAEPAPARGRNRGHPAAVRARGVPARHPGSRRHQRRGRAAHDPRPRGGRRRGRLRPVHPAPGHLGRGAARRRPRARVRAAARLPRQAGLRHDRGERRYPHRARRRTGPPRLRRPPSAGR